MNNCSATIPNVGEVAASLAFISHTSFRTSCLRGQSPGYAKRLGIMKGTDLFS